MAEANVNANIPVILACENEYIAVPMGVLVKESTVFRSMFSENWSAVTANDKQDCTEKENDNPEHENDDETKDKSSPIVPQVVQIQGFKSKGVQLTWFWIQGYEILLSKCEDFDTLSDMLAFADFYDIQRPVEAIAKQIEAVEINDANLIAALASVDKMEKIESFKEIACKLETRIKNFTESSFNTPNKVSVFVTTNADNMHLVLRLLLKCDNFTIKNCRRCGTKPQSNGYCGYCGHYCKHYCGFTS